MYKYFYNVMIYIYNIYYNIIYIIFLFYKDKYSYKNYLRKFNQ